MNNLETTEIYEILIDNASMFEEWEAYLINELHVFDVVEHIKYIDDASIIRELYFNFFDSSFNSYVDDYEN
jgi:hypothetical protein